MKKRDYMISQVGLVLSETTTGKVDFVLPGLRRVILLMNSSEKTAKRHACRLARRGHFKTSIKIMTED